MHPYSLHNIYIFTCDLCINYQPPHSRMSTSSIRLVSAVQQLASPSPKVVPSQALTERHRAAPTSAGASARIALSTAGWSGAKAVKQEIIFRLKAHERHWLL